MKKIVSIFVVVSLLVVLFVPIIASAQPVVKECCKAGRDMKWKRGKINGVLCTEAAPCNINKNDTVGPEDVKCPLPNQAGAKDQDPDRETEHWGIICLLNTIYRITDWIFYILMAFVGVMIVIGAFTIITAGGAPDKVSSGRNYVLYAVIGMVVAFFARAIPTIVKTVIGM